MTNGTYSSAELEDIVAPRLRLETRAGFVRYPGQPWRQPTADDLFVLKLSKRTDTWKMLVKRW